MGCAVISVLLTFFFLPETHHPPIPHEILKAERGRKFVPYIFNPLSILGLFRWPNICAIAFVSSCVLLETYCFIVPLATAFKEVYGITNVALSGCLYIANGGGNIIGARIAGPWCDAVVKRYLKKRGYRRPEDRLKASLLGLGFLMPASSCEWIQSGRCEREAGELRRCSGVRMAPPVRGGRCGSTSDLHNHQRSCTNDGLDSLEHVVRTTARRRLLAILTSPVRSTRTSREARR